MLDGACLHERAASGEHLLADVVRLSVAMVLAHVFVDIPVHEVGHWLAGQFLGIRWDPIHEAFSALPGWTVSAGGLALVYVAGGLLSGSVLLALAIVVPPPWRNGILPLAAAEFAYAPFDPSTVGDAMGLTAFVFVSAWIVMIYLRHYLGAADEPAMADDPAEEAARRARFFQCLASFRIDLERAVRRSTPMAYDPKVYHDPPSVDRPVPSPQITTVVP